MSEFPAYRLYSHGIPIESPETASQIPERLILLLLPPHFPHTLQMHRKDFWNEEVSPNHE